MRLLILALALAQAAAHPCDPEAQVACPFDGGASLGLCLNNPAKHEVKTELSAECAAFVKLHETCAKEFSGGTCGGSAYSEDAVLCLTSWMNPSDLSDECAGALPKKEEKVERELSDKEKSKKAARKRAREKAAKEVRELNEKNAAKGAAPKKKPRKRKSPKKGDFGDDL